MRFRLAIYTVVVLSAVVPSAVPAQGRSSLGDAADSIKYKYAGNPQLEKLKEDAVKARIRDVTLDDLAASQGRSRDSPRVASQTADRVSAGEQRSG